MATQENMFSKFLELVKSLLPRLSEPAYVSKDFWMPDSSCRVCYDCDTRFTIFVRKHHCRLCGRVFCGSCSANSIPIPSAEPNSRRLDGDRVRVCNFCFKQWEQEVAAADNAIESSNADMDNSYWTTSMISTRSSGTPESSTMTIGSMFYSNGPSQQTLYWSSPSSVRSMIVEPEDGEHDILMFDSHANSFVDKGDTCRNHFSYCNISNYDDDGNVECQSNSGAQHFQHSEEYYSRVEYDRINHDFNINEVLHDEEDAASQMVFSPVLDGIKLQDSLSNEVIAEAEPDHSDVCGLSSIHGIDSVDEPVDFENNGLLWLPPELEDEQGEREAGLFDDNDDYYYDNTGELGYLHHLRSFHSREFHTTDCLSDEHRKAIKNVVEGHFRALIAQLLLIENLPIGEEGDKESWLEIITSLSWEAAKVLRPGTSEGGTMDPGGYVKVKCIGCGHRSQSMVVKGVVCKKNVAHRHMMSKIEKPKLLILGGALEYQRVRNSFSCLDTLRQQEMDHLKMAVARIKAREAQVLLVEKSVSRIAQDYLLARNISLVLNIKRPILERISCCTGAQIVPSIDNVSSSKLGSCDLFYVEKFLEGHGTAVQGGKNMLKTLMFFEGCPKPLGCTIILKGANCDELKKVKHVVQYGFFAAYYLALETLFLADEGAHVPKPPLQSPVTAALPNNSSCLNKYVSTVPAFANNSIEPAVSSSGCTVINTQDSSKATISKEKEIQISPPLPSRSASFQMEDCTSSFITQPVASGKLHSFLSNTSSDSLPAQFATEKNNLCFGKSHFTEKSTNVVEDHANFEPVFLEDNLKRSEKGCNQVVLSDVLDSNRLNIDLQETAMVKYEFSSSPSDNQTILVSLSSRCVWKGTFCLRSHLVRITYYGSFDMPLGRFLRDHLFDKSYHCPSCEMPPEAHIQCYTHQRGSLTISVKKLPQFNLPGKRDGKIWTWHRCLRCLRLNGLPPAATRIVMSDAAWGLSFGKFLELSFSNHAAASRVASCGHSLHRDCLLFYGFGKMVACFRYASIIVHSVNLPPHKLDFNYEYQEWMQKEANEVDRGKELLLSEVLKSLPLIADKWKSLKFANATAINPEPSHHFHELEEMLQQFKEIFEESLNKVLKKDVKNGESFIDILEINNLKRQLVFQSYLWDQLLLFASESDNPRDCLNGFLVSDTQKIFPDEKLTDLNIACKMESSLNSNNTVYSDSRIDIINKDGNYVDSLVEKQSKPLDESNLTLQKTETDVDTSECEQNKASLSTSVSEDDQLDPLDMVRGAICDVKFPLLANLSDTSKKNWTCEYDPVLTGILDSSDTVDAAEPVLALEDTEEKIVANVPQSLASVVLDKLGNSAEESSSWIGLPFFNLYHSFNKNFGNIPKFNALNEYNPVYISSFLKLEHQGGGRLLLPVGENEIVIPVYDDEPTSIISYALVSTDYHIQMSDDWERTREVDSSFQSALGDSVNLNSFYSVNDVAFETFQNFDSTEEGIMSLSGSKSSLDPLMSINRMHAKVSFESEGPLGRVRYTVTCYYAMHFDALRRNCCPSELDYIRSLSRCKKWRAQGGKSNVFFAKSLDDRFIIKQITKTEIESFIDFAPGYFKYLSESIATRSPTCLAKILGIYQVSTKHLKSGKETKIDVLVMENLLFGRNVTRLYDLKGSSRARYNPDLSGSNKVLLDQNLVEAMPKAPIFVGDKAKRLLERAVWNDTYFLASIDVMDYSLLVGVDEKKQELVIGIIDFVRQYTWDKHLETWVKASGILGGPKSGPKQYKKRFRKAMSAYFIVVPDGEQHVCLN
ncbi:1-phosphatidylinositol-3-phosphate 5-kinase FAB1B-like isoform X2 [Phalaenopsis equestris]|uniref:1-phosphatidylinositol-3-phosphate 5-kinase FAB1B-like isoform X2 n=1 Tax=Phalaenopsis equestris TaxID=78828 RepID=UPI0009E4B1A9|nr:1-phosphatidylinositol-3-phosphate 5-kinase FAB1B-like isoform X2 [Phalaenopsis equestris]